MVNMGSLLDRPAQARSVSGSGSGPGAGLGAGAGSSAAASRLSTPSTDVLKAMMRAYSAGGKEGGRFLSRRQLIRASYYGDRWAGGSFGWWLVGCQVGWISGHLATVAGGAVGWLAGWLVGWLVVGWLLVWLAGWLITLMTIPFNGVPYS